jgi:hypothetical protein
MQEPDSCPTCGSSVYWWRKGTAECAGCHPEPFNPFAKKAIIAIIDGVKSFESLDMVRAKQAASAWAYVSDPAVPAGHHSP